MSGFSPGSTPLTDPSGTFFGPKGGGTPLLAGNFLATYGAAVGGAYIYSQKGTSWNIGNTPGKNAFGAAYGGTGAPKWVMTTGAQAILTSTDGVTWTDQGNILPSADIWVDVAWSSALNLFAAINNNNAANHLVATSPDGLVWTQRTTPAGVGTLFNIKYISRFGKFYAFNGPGAAANSGCSSPDGINWTLITPTAPPDNSGYVYDLGAAFGLFGLTADAIDWIRSTDGIAFAGIGPPPNYPGNGNTTGARYGPINGVIYTISGAGPTASLNKANNADLTAQWLQVTANVLPGLLGAPKVPVFSPGAGLWALAGGAVNATQILTTVDGLNYTIFNPTAAIAAILNRIMVAA